MMKINRGGHGGYRGSHRKSLEESNRLLNWFDFARILIKALLLSPFLLSSAVIPSPFGPRPHQVGTNKL
jgi:hypothetical protein